MQLGLKKLEDYVATSLPLSYRQCSSPTPWIHLMCQQPVPQTCPSLPLRLGFSKVSAWTPAPNHPSCFSHAAALAAPPTPRIRISQAQLFENLGLSLRLCALQCLALLVVHCSEDMTQGRVFICSSSVPLTPLFPSPTHSSGLHVSFRQGCSFPRIPCNTLS